MNFWLKAMGAALLTGSFFIAGVLSSARYRKRVAALEQSRLAILALQKRLQFTLAPPFELLSALCSEGGPMPDYIEHACRACRELGFEKAWQSGISNTDLCLSEQDKSLLLQVGSIIGRSDIETQSGQLALITEQIDTALSSARSEAQTRSRLCVTLWSFAGISVCVMLA